MHPWFTAAELIPTLTTKPLATESAGEHTRGLRPVPASHSRSGARSRRAVAVLSHF